MKMQNCPQSENLVAYLYGEANDAQKKDFKKHLSSCSLCSEELAAFGVVRESVIEWREDVLNNIVMPAFAKDIIAKQEQKRSAFVAIREFFTLSPLWLRGATTFAAIALIALMMFAVVQLTGNKSNNVVANENKKSVAAPSPQESPKEVKKNNDNDVANNKVTAPEKPQVVKDEKTIERKTIKANRTTQTAANKSPRNANKTLRLKDEEIFSQQIAYSDEDDSLHLSSIQNPLIKD